MAFSIKKQHEVSMALPLRLGLLGAPDEVSMQCFELRPSCHALWQEMPELTNQIPAPKEFPKKCLRSRYLILYTHSSHIDV